MGRHRGPMSARCFHQLAKLQRRQSVLHCTLGKPGFVGQNAQAGIDRSPALASSAAGKIEIDEECRRLLIVSDNIAHEHIQNVIIDRHGLMEARHTRILMLYL